VIYDGIQVEATKLTCGSRTRSSSNWKGGENSGGSQNAAAFLFQAKRQAWDSWSISMSFICGMGSSGW